MGGTYMNHRIESMRPSASMVLMAKAKELQKQDPTVIGLAGGEPDFSTPDRISMAAIRSLSEGYTHYVVGPGLPELRAAIRKKPAPPASWSCWRKTASTGTRTAFW